MMLNSCHAAMVRGLSGIAARVLFALCCYAGRTLHAFPSVSRIARDIECTPRHVQRGLRELAEKGLLENTGRHTKFGTLVRNMMLREGVTPAVTPDMTYAVTPSMGDIRCHPKTLKKPLKRSCRPPAILRGHVGKAGGDSAKFIPPWRKDATNTK